MRIDTDLLDPVNFHEFIQRLKNNDEYIWNTLDFVLKRVIYNWILKRGITDVKAKNIYQDTFSTFYEKVSSCDFKNFNKLKSYVLAIAANKIKESYRDEMREQKLMAIENVNPKNLFHPFYLNDEVHHAYNKTNDKDIRKWKEFLLSSKYNFKYILGFTGTAYVNDDYFNDVIF